MNSDIDGSESWEGGTLAFRCARIEHILSDYTRRNLRFDKVTYLARCVAEDITRIEKERMRVLHPGIRVELSRRCHSSTLLRSKVYRPYLDEWFGVGSTSNSEFEIEKKLSFELLVLSNKYKLLEEKYVDLVERLEVDGGSSKISSMEIFESEAGYMMVDSLLKHFKGFYMVEDGALVEPSATRPIIISHSLYTSFLKWRAKLVL